MLGYTAQVADKCKAAIGISRQSFERFIEISCGDNISGNTNDIASWELMNRNCIVD